MTQTTRIKIVGSDPVLGYHQAVFAEPVDNVWHLRIGLDSTLFPDGMGIVGNEYDLTIATPSTKGFVVEPTISERAAACLPLARKAIKINWSNVVAFLMKIIPIIAALLPIFLAADKVTQAKLNGSLDSLSWDDIPDCVKQANDQLNSGV
jgi:hypothetical protein